MTASRLREWVKLSQPNARLTYAEGNILDHCCRLEVRELVGALYDKGFVTPHFVRGRHGLPSRFIVQRTHREYKKGMAL